MAVIDPNDDCVVIRIVYDGAPMAGKTTSVAALGRGLGVGVHSPAEYSGRTLYFDWLDYTGGLFEGRRIRCQIVSVPGQATLAPRRRRLLQSADAVVFVGDSSPAGFAADRRYLGGLCGVLREVSGPPVGIVFQANKRDLADATPLDRVRSMLDELLLPTAIVESVATEGAGIREAFVFAVRLALDRVRELTRSGALKTVRPNVNSADDLLNELRGAEAGALDLAVASGRLEHTQLHELQGSGSLASDALQEAMQSNLDSPRASAPTTVATSTASPAIPDEKVASGMVWPPVEGRTILHEIARATINLQPADGSWCGDVDRRWSLHSAADAVFDDVEAGRTELVQWARMHAANSEIISKQRCIVLASDGRGRFRLWQLVRSEPSLRSRIEAALLADAAVIATAVLSSARAFLEMAERSAAATCELPLTLHTTGFSTSGAMYVGNLPASSAPPPRRWLVAQATDALLSELEFARPTLQAHRSSVLAELAKIARHPGFQTRAHWHLLQRLAAFI